MEFFILYYEYDDGIGQLEFELYHSLDLATRAAWARIAFNDGISLAAVKRKWSRKGLGIYSAMGAYDGVMGIEIRKVITK